MPINSPQPDESEKLVALAQATGFFTAQEISIIREMLAEYFANSESDEFIWAIYRAESHAPPLGFACYGSVSMSDNVYDLYWLAVDAGHQNKKIGTALLEHVEDDLKKRNARQLYIETSDTLQYTPTRAFYMRRGYAQVAHLTDFYHISDGKVIYRKIFR